MVYVDNMDAPFGRMTMCHMLADTHDELVAMADKIGVARKWIQKAGQPFEHLDICKSKKALAVRFGAKEISYPMEVAPILQRKREQAREQAQHDRMTA
jgi:hypothetical protein